MNNETLTATTARAIIMTFSTAPGEPAQTRRFPVGTEVYARPRRNGKGLKIRVVGTLWEQHVSPADVIIA